MNVTVENCITNKLACKRRQSNQPHCFQREKIKIRKRRTCDRGSERKS